VPTVHANGVDLYVEVTGDGLPVLGIHGTPSSALLWVDAAAVHAENGRRAIIYDRRGFGRSGPSPSETSDLDEHVEDAVALLHALAARPAVVIGRSTGGLIALTLAQRYPEVVHALVLLEGAVFTVDPEASAWATGLREEVLRASTDDPSSASEVVFRVALGAGAWASFPTEIRELFAEASTAVLAEIRGRGLDLSAEPLVFSHEEVAGVDIPTLLVSSEDSPVLFQRINDRLAELLPHAEKVLVPGGHIIDPAHPTVLEFLSRLHAEHGVVSSTDVQL
jgi:pimeloyl-ACP methyl ester carboxylesterase